MGGEEMRGGWVGGDERGEEMSGGWEEMSGGGRR